MALRRNGAMVEWRTAVKNAKGIGGISVSLLPASIRNLTASDPELKARLGGEKPTRNHLSYRKALCFCGLLIILCLPYIHSKVILNVLNRAVAPQGGECSP